MIAPALLASTAIILLSFISEDAATISSALSIFGGPLSWPLGFVSCFAGIWLGDLGLYSLARYAGKNVLHSRWLARLADPATITRCEKTFAQNSTFTLIATHFIPGTRLPTYLAAGLFAMPARRFALITAIGATPVDQRFLRAHKTARLACSRLVHVHADENRRLCFYRALASQCGVHS